MSPVSTEKKILTAAEEVFYEKGLAGARMQEIADRAGINKALLHYYYRSKDKLFGAVFIRVMKLFAPQLLSILSSDLPLDMKIYKFVDRHISFLSQNPLLPLFILTELQRAPEELISQIGMREHFKKEVISRQLEEEHRKGNIRSINPDDFLVNMISLTVFQFAARPMIMGILNMKENEYLVFIENRKKEIPQTIINDLRKTEMSTIPEQSKS